MTARRIHRHVESIIGAATAAGAYREAKPLRSVLAHSDFDSTLTRMIAEELEANGKSRRFITLTRLSEYIGAVTRNTLRAGLSADEPLPELLILAGGSEGETEDEDLRPDSFKQWLQIIRSQQRPAEKVPEGETLGDLERHRLLKSIQDTLLNVSLSLSNKAVSKATVATLERLIRDCDRLLNAPPSRHFDTKAYDLPVKKVEALRSMGAVEAALGNISEAKRLYEQAAHAYDGMARSFEAVRCLVDVAFLEAHEERDIDRAIDRLRELLERVTKPSLEAAEVLTSLAELYGGARREDQEALRYLGQAEATLRAAGFAPPGGRDIAQALMSALMSDGGNKSPMEAFKQPDVLQRSLQEDLRRLREDLSAAATLSGRGSLPAMDRGRGRHDPRRQPNQHRVHRGDDQEPRLDDEEAQWPGLARPLRDVSS
jgi:tetratricopeptide (TPR) repeat protein